MNIKSRRILGLRYGMMATLAVAMSILCSGQIRTDTTLEPHSKSPLRWDNIKAGQPPVYHLFSGEYPAAMFPRPGELTLDNWFDDGHLRTYALMNLDDVLHCTEIRRGHGPVYMFGNARIPDLLDGLTITLSGEGFPKEDTLITLRELFSWMSGQAIIVVRHGKIVYEEYGGMDPGQRHHWMSVSKSTLNMMLGKLVTEGKIDLSRKVQDYIPEFKEKSYGSFKVQEVADMDADVNEREKNANWGEFCRAIGWFNDNGKWPGGARQILTTIERLEKPAEAKGVRYTFPNAEVIAWIIENITGEPITEYFEKNIWWHIGAIANAAVTVDKHGVPFAGGGYTSTLRDLARYGEIWANNGLSPDGTRIFSTAWMKENTSGKGPLIFRDYRYHNQSYSKGTYIAHQGHSGQILWVNTASGTIVACFGSLTGGSNKWSARAQLLMAEKIDQYLQKRRIAE